MRRYDGSINYNLKSQKSYQASGGFDYYFKLFQRPARFTTEAYYKYMIDVVPYDIDNVRLRYYGENNAKAYAAGIEGPTEIIGAFRFNGDNFYCGLLLLYGNCDTANQSAAANRHHNRVDLRHLL